MINAQICSVYNETMQKHAALEDRVADFVTLKSENHMQLFGASDKPFIATGPLGKLKIRHAHLSQDISILYRIAGSPPTMYLFGLFSHKETGTSSTSNHKLQKSLATRLGRQFTDLHDAIDLNIVVLD
jgi:hypothetical protein